MLFIQLRLEIYFSGLHIMICLLQNGVSIFLMNGKTVMSRKGVSLEESNKRANRANQAFPDALVNNYSGLISSLQLPDPKDRHVLAAAIKTNANVIVTNNIKDFPKEYLASFGLTVKTADDFLTDIVDLNPDLAVKAFKELVLNRRNPDLDEFQVLDILRNRGLKDTADFLHTQL